MSRLTTKQRRARTRRRSQQGRIWLGTTIEMFRPVVVDQAVSALYKLSWLLLEAQKAAAKS